MINVKQFELRLEIEPAGFCRFFLRRDRAFAHSSLTEEGLWRTGGASITQTKRGTDTLGTLALRTGDDFAAGMQVPFFSLRPSSSDLNMGVVINGG